MLKKIIRWGLITLFFSATVLANTATPEPTTTPFAGDPYEKFNRAMYGFNKGLDKMVIKYVAYGYYAYTPTAFQAGTHHFFENLSQPITIANDLLQLKIGYFAHDLSRFIINSTFGCLGLFDVAEYMGLSARQETFGSTLQCWGYKKSYYLVLPILGPSTLRDTLGWVIDSRFFNPLRHLKPTHLQYELWGLDLIDKRANFFVVEKMLQNISTDEYTLIRNIYFQKREPVLNNDPFAEPGFE